ncbi:MAG: hypothetical protein ACQER9_01260 [Nanobdellota archaeon]
MEELYEFAGKITKIPKKELKQYNLDFNLQKLNDFEKFLLDSRMLKFLLLHIINKQDKQYIILYETTKEQQEEITKELGISAINKVIKKEELFSEILFQLGFSQIESKMVQGDMIFQKNPKTEHYLTEGQVIMSTDGNFILKDKEIYTNDETIKPLIDFIKKKTEELFNYAENKTIVHHEIYIKWLMEWFPGKIRIRMLEN